MRMQSAPQIDVLLIESGEPPWVAGVSVPTGAPALTNAIVTLTRTRVRRLPTTKTIRAH
jgi:isoquinoline 1-oxidoreductase beta subunit